MPKLQLGNIWTILREIDFGDIHAEAEQPVDIVVAGTDDRAVDKLAGILRTGEAPPAPSVSVVRTVSQRLAQQDLAHADLLIAIDLPREALTAVQDQTHVILVGSGEPATLHLPALVRIDVPTISQEHVTQLLAPAIIEQLDEKSLAAARRLPLLRPAYGEWLINETSRANALYAFSTGLAETVPGLNVPLNVADIIVLTKNQVNLVYKLALAAGRPLSPRAVIKEMLGVVGAGFMWRQAARELVGLIPVVGIVPKVAVAYGGTYAVGEAAQTYLIEGKVPGKDQLKNLYREALDRGRALAQSLIQRQQTPNQQTDKLTN